jgi:hypothetical protein
MATVITGNGIQLYRWLAISAGIRLEAKGLRRSRGVSCTALAKRELGVTGNRDKVLAAVEARIAEIGATIKPGEIQA